MENKLIPMTTFVTDQPTTYEWGAIIPQYRLYQNILKYAQFLKQSLALWMFVPVDENRNILKEPNVNEYMDSDNEPNNTYFWEAEEYRKAKDKVLFEGFEFESKVEVINKKLKLTIFLSTFQFMNCDENGLGGGDLFGQNIDALAYADLNLTLTETAIKQIYGS
ncbi:hypothetical protein CMT42_15435 [Elizabethkingia anophelis]|uniref:Uncharacterized protein n=2 Tax=Elizabethkingia anophelis TaxID=1117645 RepID=A0A494J258_9FLAO|nr:hypothetical protein [Elizabethkingia anophelis]AQX52529.1 hypothetical protein AYC66_18405 [Elizabethkingia anophelis]MCT4101705.1 hypothetical protein [Elizabethkingia anophelis]MCT4166033.1 hypothetical protein [Elizabethkingia anophelis]MDV3551047.1 hypothetical protein [Elizabethkingia anophelis]MDV3570125.1 hypothetical protein [Elizabethkingia anophelis]